MAHIVVAKGFTDRQDTYDLADGIETVEQAVSRFLNGDPLPPIEQVRVNGRPARDYSDQVRDGDTIILQEHAVATGGLKGAS